MKRPLGVALIGVAVIAALTGAGVHWATQSLDEPALMPGPLIYRVPSHAGFGQVAADLKARGVLQHPRILTLYARYRGVAAQIKAGEYSIDPHVTPRKLLQQLIEGQVLLHSFTIVDGWQVRELLDAIRRSPDIHRTLPASEADLMARFGSPRESPEGQFLPETYKFPAGTTDVEFLAIAHAALVKELSADWADRDARVPVKTRQELLTLASIVEKETALTSERAKIAGVYIQRLITGMRLQADPTVIYGLGDQYDGDIHTVDLRTDGPYNTYTRAGLPPTPIALAGAPAIRAAAKPEITGALYFVASGLGDGSHVFSATLQEHNEAVARYLKRLRQRS